MNQISLKTKLILGFGSLALLLAGLGATSFYQLREVSGKYEHVVNVNFPNTVFLTRMRGLQKDVVIQAAGMSGAHLTPEEIKAAEVSIQKSETAFAETSKGYLEIPFVPGEEELWNAVDAGWKPFLAMTKELLELSAKATKESEAERDAKFSGEYKKLRTAFVASIGKIVDFQSAETKAWSEKAKDSAAFAGRALAFSVIIGFFIALFLAWFLSRQLSRALGSVTETLSTQSTEMSSVVTQLASASQELSAASTEQAAALQETAAAVEEISSMVKKSSESAKDSAAASESSRAKAERGKAMVGEMVESIREIDASNSTISSAIDASNRHIEEIITVIREIGSKTKVINDIVFQTKLLSFNASVEAARAGEHGKGFAVVAEEVGNLAQMSGNASREISEMLEASVKKVEGIVHQTKSTVGGLIDGAKTTVARGAHIAEECGQFLEQIVADATVASEMVTGISDASLEQARGVNEISKAIQELNEATHTNAVAANQCATSAEHLDVQASALRGAALQLGLVVNGGKLAAPIPPRTKKKSSGPAKPILRSAVAPATRATVPDADEFRDVA